jgi:hypothetical protein
VLYTSDSYFLSTNKDFTKLVFRVRMSKIVSRKNVLFIKIREVDLINPTEHNLSGDAMSIKASRFPAFYT